MNPLPSIPMGVQVFCLRMLVVAGIPVGLLAPEIAVSGIFALTYITYALCSMLISSSNMKRRMLLMNYPFALLGFGMSSTGIFLIDGYISHGQHWVLGLGGIIGLLVSLAVMYLTRDHNKEL